MWEMNQIRQMWPVPAPTIKLWAEICLRDQVFFSLLGEEAGNGVPLREVTCLTYRPTFLFQSTFFAWPMHPLTTSGEVTTLPVSPLLTLVPRKCVDVPMSPWKKEAVCQTPARFLPTQLVLSGLIGFGSSSSCVWWNRTQMICQPKMRAVVGSSLPACHLLIFNG